MSTSEERKLATVLFADLVGSTAAAEDEDPERVRLLLDRFYDSMRGEIERTGGTVEKFAGDAVMAVFGAPAALEDHAERALHAALAMQRRQEEVFPELELRIGVNTGEVVAGTGRDGNVFVSGDAVNVGARLEQAAAPGEILAGERTVAAALGAFEFGDQRTIEAKGKTRGVPCRPVVRALSLARPRGARGLQRAFVGRESELELLWATYRRTASLREPHLVTVVGAPGVGKSRLVDELWTALESEDPPPLRRTGRCLPYGDGITYWPLREVLREHLGLTEGDASEAVRERLAGREILGLVLGLDLVGDVHPLEARERLHAAFAAFVDEAASSDALVLLVEDVHWAEPDLLDLLERTVREVSAPLMLVVTCRPDLYDWRPSWGAGGRRNATTIWLEPLSGDATNALLRDLLALEPPEQLRTLVFERAEGNPFFVEELVSALVETGALERRDGGWEVRELARALSIPDTVHAVIAARIDRLPATEKAALQAASVVGRAFSEAPVTHLLGGTRPDFGLLEERDFIRRSSSPSLEQREYAMKHALTREVAYTSIPKARRGRLHAILAEWMAESGRAGDEHASLLAYHYAEAVRPEDADLVWAEEPETYERLRRQAVSWLRRAGQLAGSRHEMEEAVSLLTRAASLTHDERERAGIWHEIGRVQALRYDGAAMRSALLRAVEGPLDDAERAEAYAFLAFQASIRSAMWSIRLNREQIEEWASRALDLADERSEARVRALLARVNVEPAEARADLVEAAYAAADALRDPALRSYALGARSQAAFERRRFHEAAAWTVQRFELLEEIADPDHRCDAYEAAVPVLVAVERFEEARRASEQHWELALRLSAHHRVHAVSLPLEIEDALGDWAALAERTDLVADAVAANLRTPCVRNPRDLLLCAFAHFWLGDADRAGELERDAEEIAAAGYESYLAAPRLRLALARGDRRALERLLELPIERAFVWGPAVYGARLDALVAVRRADVIEHEAPGLRIAGTYVEPFALRALAAARHDDELLARAQERFAALGLHWHAAQTERLLEGL